MELGNTEAVNAYGDGRRVLLTRGMLKTFTSDDDLAFAIAGEMARNALNQQAKLHNVNTMSAAIENLSHLHPELDKLPQLRPPGEEYDLAADKRALYMLARANYPFENYLQFWTRISAQGNPADAYAVQHPLTPRRSSAITRVIAEIKGKQAAKKPIQP
jgi:predicted Zn-dependent protease